MRSLLQVVRSTSEAGQDLPEILPAFSAATIKFRRGQLHVIAGQPGGGKTMLSLWYAIKSNTRVLYFNADSDQGTIVNRASAILLDRTVDEVKAMRETEEIYLIEDELIELSQRIRIEPNPHPTLDDIYEETEAYVELFGCPPDLIVVDNLLNLAAAHDNEWTAMRDAMSALHSLARETESAVVVLHHVSENDSKPEFPAARKALMGKVSQLPELILTVAMSGDNYLVAAVKNRDGVSDPGAEKPIRVAVDPSRMCLFNNKEELEMANTRRTWQ